MEILNREDTHPEDLEKAREEFYLSLNRRTERTGGETLQRAKGI